MPTSTAEISIREARAGDAEQLALIYCEDAAYHAAFDPDLYVVPKADEMVPVLHGQIASSEPMILVAEGNEGTVGFITISIRDAGERPSMLHPRTSAWLGIAVSAKYRGRGIGSRLMAAAERLATDLGADELVLDVHVANAPAIRFYERLGYQTRGLILTKPGSADRESS